MALLQFCRIKSIRSNKYCFVLPSPLFSYSNADRACTGRDTTVPDGGCNQPGECCNRAVYGDAYCDKFVSPTSLGKNAAKHTHTRTPVTNDDEPEASGENVFPSQFPTPSLSPYSTSNGGNHIASHPGVTVTDQPNSSSFAATAIPTASQEDTTPTYGPTSGESEAAEVPVESGCSKDFCTVALSGDCTLAYRVNDGITITVVLTCDGSDEWVGIGFSKDGQMQNSEAVLGVPGHQPLKYALNGKYTAAVVQMPEHKQTLMDATLEVDQDGHTVMKFTKILREHMLDDKEEIFLLYAKGMSSTLGYHPTRSSFKLDI